MKKRIIFVILGILLLVSISFFITKKEIFNIYTLNIETEDLMIKSQSKLSKSQSIEKKIIFLTKKLSNDNFEKKSIYFDGIKLEEGKKIGYFDLRDTNEKDSWYPYFQGSFGAFSTKISIVETLLQRDFDGNWLDGIKLSYNGKFEEFDHISFEDAIYWRKIKN